MHKAHLALVASLLVALPVHVSAQTESPNSWGGGISMDSLTRLREDSILTYTKARKGCRPDKKVVHRMARESAVVPTDTLGMIAGGDVWVGLHSGWLLAVRGNPDQVNRTTTSAGTSEQWVYKGYRGRNIYIYVENKRVTAIQD